MSKSDTPTTQSPASYPGPGTNDVTALLLEVLRNVNSEVKTTLELDGRAQAAVVHFQAISISLRTLTDDPPSSFTGGTSLGAAARAPAR